jgi:hypothetical protein
VRQDSLRTVCLTFDSSNVIWGTQRSHATEANPANDSGYALATAIIIGQVSGCRIGLTSF